ncbi:NAD(P)/FAD-dependent oxidoreductase [Agrococcus casei]|uniref:NAD(P)/FAD-dependent oxidoreductase n=1 Tax=Agrococcus casei TaxID=343512 RepID=UPI003F92E8F5
MAVKILIVGGGYAGFYTARGLERMLKPSEASITVVDPNPYMTYLPFLPEVAAGSIDPRHSVVSLRRHLKATEVVGGRVTKVDHSAKTAEITPETGEAWVEEYDVIVMTAGSVSRTFPIPGVADHAIGMKSIEEAVYVRDRLIGNFARAAALPVDSPEREALLTFTVVGGGFAGIETIAEMRSLATSLIEYYPQITIDDTHFHLVEAMGRIMPEVSEGMAEWVVQDLERRFVNVHLNTQLQNAEDKLVQLSTGEEFKSDIIVWTAGVMANPMVRTTDFPIDERGRLTALPTLQIAEDGTVVPDAWTAGDVSAVPDISKTPGPGGFCVPNAQHAVRQGKLMAKNIVAVLRAEQPIEYNHANQGAVAGLGIGNGVFQSGKFKLKGWMAWMAHRVYHGMAMPMFERKARVFSGWINNQFLGRDIAPTEHVLEPRVFFETYASRPKPKVEEAPKADEAAKADAAPKEDAKA